MLLNLQRKNLTSRSRNRSSQPQFTHFAPLPLQFASRAGSVRGFVRAGRDRNKHSLPPTGFLNLRISGAEFRERDARYSNLSKTSLTRLRGS